MTAFVKCETNNFINSFAERVERQDRVHELGQLEHKIKTLKKHFNPNAEEDDREMAQEHIVDQETKLASLKKQIAADKAEESEAENEFAEKQTKIASLRESIAQLEE